ncbi:hypothetical protein [Caloranaerobacter sp. DY30410]|uniref:hypothetical protein n=1 Tax=Caloranaerobacter sp. DY30410 TaxID=3238305 RepID=UPI003CFDCED5
MSRASTNIPLKRFVANTDNIKSIILKRPPSSEDYSSDKDNEIEKVSINLIRRIFLQKILKLN